MPVISHQTVRLGRGSHRSPEHGACVMELSSMLAGERFTHRPASVCFVIAELLRSYNDGVDDERRQGLYGCASLVVGSRANIEVVRRRVERLREVVVEAPNGCSRFQRWVQGSRMRRAGERETATCAAHVLVSDRERGLERLVALVEELVAMRPKAPDAASTAPRGFHEPPVPQARIGDVTQSGSEART
jgi:hypothetical protein